jgi:integrase
MQVRKVRGPLLDTLYAQLMRCGSLACTGRPFTEHRNVPDLRPDSSDPQPEWQQAADKLRAAIETGELAPGDALPSVPDLAQLQGLKPGTVRIQVHVCKPMAKSTIHIIHSILSGAFEAAERWEWVDRNPADSARPPTVTQKKRPATPPADVVNVIDQARATGQHDIALYLWLVAITGVRRGELCAVQIADIDLSSGVVHIAFNYVVKAGQKLRKDTKTRQERHIAIDPVTCALIQETLDETTTALAAPTGSPTASAILPRPPGSTWTSRESGTTPPASSLPRASTSAIPPPDLGIPAGAPPR